METVDADVTAGRTLVNRRQLLRWGAVTVGVTLAAPGLLNATSQAMPLADRAPDAASLADLPLVYGTPTDLARIATETVWTQDSDGAVLVFDRDQGVWASASQDWPTVLTYGTARLAAWGRPRGPNQTVLVYGSVPDTPTTTPTTTAPPSTTPNTTPTTGSTETTGGVTSTSSPPATNSSSSPAYGGVTTPATWSNQYGSLPGGSSGGAQSEQAGGQLSYTGINLGRLGMIAAGLLAAGAGLLAVRRHRIEPAPGPVPNEDPADPDQQPD